MEMLQGVWKPHLRPRAVVGYGVKIFLPSPPNYVTRSPGQYCYFIQALPQFPTSRKAKSFRIASAVNMNVKIVLKMSRISRYNFGSL